MQRLSHFYIISDDPIRSFDSHDSYNDPLIKGKLSDFTQRLQAVLSSTATLDPPPLVQIRLKSVSLKLVSTIVLNEIPQEYRFRVLINTSRVQDLKEALSTSKSCGAGGVHLAGNVLQEMAQCPSALEIMVDDVYGREKPARGGPIIGASCHNVTDLVNASRLALNFVVLSPVLPSTTCPSSNTLGWEKFSQMIQDAQAIIPKSPLLVYALGGVAPKDLSRAKDAGAIGIAAIKAFWHDMQFES